MTKIQVSTEIFEVCPSFKGAALFATFRNSQYNEDLWQEINLSINQYRISKTTEDIKEIPSIHATRAIYRKLGKDPSRYRPSGEALIRRTLQGKDLYQINTAVDLINLASIEFGYSIGGFDHDKIQGDITLGVGQKDESYEGIGKGQINIEGLPVYRDGIGGFGTPTSDTPRTQLSLNTTHLLTVVNGYDGDANNVEKCAIRMVELLQKYAQCSQYHIVKF